MTFGEVVALVVFFAAFGVLAFWDKITDAYRKWKHRQPPKH